MPKYFGGNLSADKKVFKSPSEIKMGRELRKAYKDIQSSRDAASKSKYLDPNGKDKDGNPVGSDGRNKGLEDALSNFENATSDTTKARYGLAYLKKAYPSKYADYMNEIQGTTVQYGLDPQENPFIRYLYNLEKNHSGIDLSNNPDIIKKAIEDIAQDPDIVDDKDSYIYKDAVHDKVKELQGKDKDRFLLLVSILSDEDKVSTYFDNITRQQRNDLIDKLVKAGTFGDMKKLVDDAQERDKNPSKRGSDEKKPVKKQPAETTALASSLKAILANDTSRDVLGQVLSALSFKGDVRNTTPGIIKKYLNPESIKGLDNLMLSRAKSLMSALGLSTESEKK